MRKSDVVSYSFLEVYDEHDVSRTTNHNSDEPLSRLQQLSLFLRKRIRNVNERVTEYRKTISNLQLQSSAPITRSCTDLTQDKSQLVLKNGNSEDQLFKYYHVFTDKEFLELLDKVESLKVLDKYFDNRNWVFIVEKI